MITYQDGNVLDAKEKIIVHGCNAKGVMGSGVAKAIRERWPGAYEAYRKQFEEKGLELGETIFYLTKENKIIVNAITQKDFGSTGKRFVDYEAIKVALKEVDDMAKALNYEIAMPQIGAGLGGGDWKKIETIIEETCSQPVTVYLFK